MNSQAALSLREIHDRMLASTGNCPDDVNCPFCLNDRIAAMATRDALPNPEFCYTPDDCAGKTCCPHNPSCTE